MYIFDKCIGCDKKEVIVPGPQAEISFLCLAAESPTPLNKLKVCPKDGQLLKEEEEDHGDLHSL